MNKKIKISLPQVFIIGLLREGWKMEFYGGLLPAVGIRKDSEHTWISMRTWNSLLKKGLIQEDESLRDYHIKMYVLTELGKNAILN